MSSSVDTKLLVSAARRVTFSHLTLGNSARYFPHEIADLSIALEFIQQKKGLGQHSFLWATRYVTLLWLYIICIIPFDLAQFDEPDKLGKTASDLEAVAKRYLGTSGLEREAAALLLSRLYTR